MEAQALICDAQHDFALREVSLPDPGANDVVVRTLWSGVSIGTEFMFVRGTLDGVRYPLCTGYMATGVVESAGAEVSGYAAGDLVYFRASPGMVLDGAPVHTVAGSHASHAVLDAGRPDTALLPDGVPVDIASAFVLPGVGLHGVDISNPRLGDSVLVFGVGLVGLSVVVWANQRGCVVVAVDRDAARLEVARKLGARHLIDASTTDAARAVEERWPGGCDVVFEATGLPANIDAAIALTRPRGKFVWQGHYGKDPIHFRYPVPHGKRVKMFFPCNDGEQPAREMIMHNLALGYLPWQHAVTHRVCSRDAPNLYRGILHGNREGVIGALIHWSDR
ncbi:MAG: zinc-binding dehydrogenase [Spirochaetaceae bacterium]|nr:zinc-binding dehydrogenase [Spirochaetaceae bacterium]